MRHQRCLSSESLRGDHEIEIDNRSARIFESASQLGIVLRRFGIPRKNFDAHQNSSIASLRRSFDSAIASVPEAVSGLRVPL